MRRSLLFLFLLLFSNPCFSGDISGTVSVKSHGEVDLSDSVVYIEKVPAKEKFPVPQEKPKMASHNKQFEPRVLPILVGTTVDFPNEDDILHNVFSLSKAKSFDLGLYKKKGMTTPITFDKTGIVKVYCNIHETMSGFVLVLQNPYFAKASKTGHYEIKGVPAGKYMLHAWSRFADEKKASVQVGNAAQTVDFQLSKD